MQHTAPAPALARVTSDKRQVTAGGLRRLPTGVIGLHIAQVPRQAGVGRPPRSSRSRVEMKQGERARLGPDEAIITARPGTCLCPSRILAHRTDRPVPPVRQPVQLGASPPTSQACLPGHALTVQTAPLSAHPQALSALRRHPDAADKEPTLARSAQRRASHSLGLPPLSD